jgi:hypothetical protein
MRVDGVSFPTGRVKNAETGPSGFQNWILQFRLDN